MDEIAARNQQSNRIDSDQASPAENATAPSSKKRTTGSFQTGSAFLVGAAVGGASSGPLIEKHYWTWAIIILAFAFSIATFFILLGKGWLKDSRFLAWVASAFVATGFFMLGFYPLAIFILEPLRKWMGAY